MIIEKNNSVNWKNLINSSKRKNKDIYDHKNINNIILKKANLNNGGNLPIKVHLMSRNSKKEQFSKINNSINKGLTSSFYIKNNNKFNNDRITNTSSSFRKKNIKIINEGNFPKNLNNENKKVEIKKLKELLNDSKDIKNSNSNSLKKEKISFKNIKRYETDNNQNKKEEIEKKEINIINKINILNLNINKKYIKNINKEKIYNLIKEKNKTTSDKNNINDENKNSKDKKNINEEYINNSNGNGFFSRSEKKQENVSSHKIRNILSKNFAFNSKTKFKTLNLFNNNQTKKSNSPDGVSITNTVSDNDNIIFKDKNINEYNENKNDNDVKSIKTNNSKDTFKITNSVNTKTTTSNMTEKKNNLLNNILDLNSSLFPFDSKLTNKKSVISSFHSRRENKMDIIKSNNTSKSPKKIIFYDINKNKNKRYNSDLETNKSFESRNNFKYLYELENINDDNNNDVINIKFDELILLEERVNDIYLAINNWENSENGVGEMNNECLEFFKFYLSSSLNNKLTLFFSEDNFIIIQSSINLELFIIMFLYHISFDSQILNLSINLLIEIFNKLKINYCLIIRQILNYYNNINYYEIKEKKLIMTILNNSDIYEVDNLNEDEIILKINDNCTNISNKTHTLLKIYYEHKKNNFNYYNDFMNIFNQLSIIKERDITNYFYNNIYKIDNLNTDNINKNKTSNCFLNYQNFNSNKKNRNTSPYKQNSIEYNLYKNKNIYLNSFCKDINLSRNNNNIEQNDEIDFNNRLSFYHMNNKTNFSKNISSKSFISNKFNYNSKNKNIISPYIKIPREKNKKYTLVLDLDETLVHVKQINLQNSNYYYNTPYNHKIINLRPGLFDFLNSIKPYYEIISFSSASKVYADHILKKIEVDQKYFDYNLYREHTTLYGQEYIKDISKIGRNIKEIIIVDNLEKNFILNPDNGIKIAPYYGELSYENEDTKLFELEKLLLLFNKLKYDDIRMGIKDYSQFIKDKISK